MNNFKKLIAIVFFMSLGAPVYAGVVLDGSMGPGGPLNGPDYDIKEIYGKLSGHNLFHSFSEFGLHADETATFNGSASIEHIIGRVTGGVESLIDGKIVSTIDGADLHLMNPAGVMFGENALLDLKGSFHVSASDYLVFREGEIFYARPRAGEVLFASAPTAFGFLNDDVAPIRLQGSPGNSSLQVPMGETITLAGGDIEIKGTRLEAPAGWVNMASVASPGEVTPTAPGLDVTSNAPGDITISDGAIVNVSGGDPGGESGGGPGSVFIRGGKFFLGNGGQITADARGAENGETIDIRADEVEVHNGGVFSSTYGSGTGGGIRILADDSITVTDGGGILADSGEENDPGEGDAGSIFLEADRISIAAGGVVSSDSYGTGHGGDLTLRASESIHISGLGSTLFAGASGKSEDAGDAGAITIETTSLSMTDQAIVNSDSTVGGGAGGSIIVRGFEGEGESADRVVLSNSRIFAGAIDGAWSGKGNGGSIAIRANRILLSDGAAIDAISTGKGDAGAIDIETTEETRLEGRSSITTTAGDEGSAGEIRLATKDLLIDQGSSVFSKSASTSENAGRAGRITVEARGSVDLIANGALSTEAAGAGGGQIYVAALERIYLLDGRITSSVQQGEGKGGDVHAASEFVILNKGEITAKAVEGDGGAIFIGTENYFKSEDSVVSAASSRGNDGTVTIEAPDLDITSGLVALPDAFLDVTQWVETPCAERSGESVSRFVVKGWDASPVRTDDLPPFDLLWFDEPNESDAPGRISPPDPELFDREEKKSAPPDCPGGNC